MKPLIILMCIAGTVLCFCLGARNLELGLAGKMYLAAAGGCVTLAFIAANKL